MCFHTDSESGGGPVEGPSVSYVQIRAGNGQGCLGHLRELHYQKTVYTVEQQLSRFRVFGFGLKRFRYMSFWLSAYLTTTSRRTAAQAHKARMLLRHASGARLSELALHIHCEGNLRCPGQG